MNKLTKILIIVISLIGLIIFTICKFRENSRYKNELKSYDKLIKNELFQNSNTNLNKNINDTTENTNTNYLTMTEDDFNKLDVITRWKYRSECLNKFNLIKHNYNKRAHYLPPRAKNNNLIFVNIASYRDPECCKTILSLILNCSNWENLRIVVCEQNSEEDKPYNYNINPMFSKIIKCIKMSYRDARGPTWARFLIQQQYSGEQYYLQIDSHTIFEKNWDKLLIDSLNNLPEKSCLTQYLPDYDIGSFKTNKKLRSNLIVSRICSLDGFTRINANYVDPNIKYDKPFESCGWSGCFSFSSGNICNDAPIDCYTPDVFFGEEMDICLRLFTRGWNFYAPNYPIAYTNFNRSYRDTFWQKKGLGYDKNITLCSRLRFHYRLGTLPLHLRHEIEEKYPELLIEVDKFKLGNVRTLSDYEKLIKYSFQNESNME